MQDHAASMANQTVMAGLNLPMHYIADMLDCNSLRRFRLASTQCALHTKHLAVPSSINGQRYIRYTPATATASVCVTKLTESKQGHCLAAQLLLHISKLGFKASHLHQLSITATQHASLHIELGCLAATFPSLHRLVLHGPFQLSVYQALFRQLSLGLGKHLKYLAIQSIDCQSVTLVPSDILLVTQHACNLTHLELPWTHLETLSSQGTDDTPWLECLSSFSHLTKLRSLSWSGRPVSCDDRFIKCLTGALQNLTSLRRLTINVRSGPGDHITRWVIALAKLKQLRHLDITIQEDSSEAVGTGLTAMTWLETLKIKFNDWALELRRTQQDEPETRNAVTFEKNCMLASNEGSCSMASTAAVTTATDSVLTDQLLDFRSYSTDTSSHSEGTPSSYTQGGLELNAAQNNSSILLYQTLPFVTLQNRHWSVTSCMARFHRQGDTGVNMPATDPKMLPYSYHSHLMNSIVRLFGISYVPNWLGFPHLASLQIHMPITAQTTKCNLDGLQHQFVHFGNTAQNRVDVSSSYILDVSTLPATLQELICTGVTITAPTAGTLLETSPCMGFCSTTAVDDQVQHSLPHGLKMLVLKHSHVQGVRLDSTSIPRNLLHFSIHHCTHANPDQHNLASIVEACPYLETLEVVGTQCTSNRMSFTDWHALKTKALNLRHLDLWSTGEGWIDTDIQDEVVIPVLSSLTQLTHLALTWGLENRPLSWLAGLPHLQSLRITLTRSAGGPCSGFGKALLRERAQQSLEYLLPNTAVNISLV